MDSTWKLKLKALYYIYPKNCEKKPQLALDWWINTLQYYKRQTEE